MLLTTTQTDINTRLSINSYFAAHPERIIHTQSKQDTNLYGKPAMVYLHAGGVPGIARDMREMFNEDFRQRFDMDRYLGLSSQKSAVSMQSQQPMPEKPKEEAKGTEAPVLTLYDLFGFTEAERKEAQGGVTKKKGANRRGRIVPVQRSLFDGQKEPQGEKTEKPEINTPHVAEAPSQQAATTNPEEVYSAINWEDNPPINGFYETMMNLTPERREQLRQKAVTHREEKKAVAAPGQKRQTGKAVGQARTPATDKRPAERNVYPVFNAVEEKLNRRIAEVEQQMQADEAALTEEERQRKKEEEMQPRPYARPLESHLREGSLAWEHTGGTRYQVGVLKDVTRYGATFQPLDLEGMQKEKARLYIDLRNAYERLYALEAKTQEENKKLA